MRRLGKIGVLLLLCLALAGSVACGSDGEAEAEPQLVEVVRGDLTFTVSGSGNIRVTTEARLAFGSGGKVDKIYFEEGDEVRVIDGPFNNFQGIVEEVKPEKEKLRVLISIFGRSTPVELDFIQVHKI